LRIDWACRGTVGQPLRYPLTAGYYDLANFFRINPPVVDGLSGCIACAEDKVARRVVGYLLAGVMVGPFTPGFVADQALAPVLAELGCPLGYSTSACIFLSRTCCL
jgi:hypothetical protein